jgi:hypothetical protein
MAKLKQGSLYAGSKPAVLIGKRLSFFGMLPLASPVCIACRKHWQSMWTGLRLFYLRLCANKIPQPVQRRMVFHLNLFFGHSVRLVTLKAIRQMQLARGTPGRMLASRSENSRKNLLLATSSRLPLLGFTSRSMLLFGAQPLGSGFAVKHPALILHEHKGGLPDQRSEPTQTGSLSAHPGPNLAPIFRWRMQPLASGFTVEHRASTRQADRGRWVEQRSENRRSLGRSGASVTDETPEALGVSGAAIKTPRSDLRTIGFRSVSRVVEAASREGAENDRKPGSSSVLRLFGSSFFAARVGLTSRSMLLLGAQPLGSGFAVKHPALLLQEDKGRLPDQRSENSPTQTGSLSAHPGPILAPIFRWRMQPLASGFTVEHRAPTRQVDRGRWVEQRSENRPSLGRIGASVAGETPEALGVSGAAIKTLKTPRSDLHTIGFRSVSWVAEAASREGAENDRKPGSSSVLGLFGSSLFAARVGLASRSIILLRAQPLGAGFAVKHPALILHEHKGRLRDQRSERSPTQTGSLSAHPDPNLAPIFRWRMQPLASGFTVEHRAPTRRADRGRWVEQGSENRPSLGRSGASVAGETPQALGAFGPPIEAPRSPSRASGAQPVSRVAESLREWEEEGRKPRDRSPIGSRGSGAFAAQAGSTLRPILRIIVNPDLAISRGCISHHSPLTFHQSILVEPPKHCVKMQPFDSGFAAEHPAPGRHGHKGLWPYRQSENPDFPGRTRTSAADETPETLRVSGAAIKTPRSDSRTIGFRPVWRVADSNRRTAEASSQILLPKQFQVEGDAKPLRLEHVGPWTAPIPMRAEAKSVEERVEQAGTNSMAEPGLGGRTTVLLSDLKRVARQDLQALSESVYDLIIDRVRREKERLGR